MRRAHLIPPARAVVTVTAVVAMALMAGCARHAPVNPYDPEIGFRLEAYQDSWADVFPGGTVTSDEVRAGESDSQNIRLTVSRRSPVIVLSGDQPIALTGQDAECFSIEAQPQRRLGPGSETLVSLVFAPTSVGEKQATLSIELNNQPESAYQIAVNGSATGSVIHLTDPSGATVSAGSTYGRHYTLPASVKIVFQIEITTGASMATELSGSPVAAITGNQAFAIVSQPEVGLVDDDTVTVSFAATEPGEYSATLSVGANGIATAYTVKVSVTAAGLTLDTSGDVGRYADIAASDDLVVISYYNATSSDLKLARSTDGGDTWNASTIESADEVGSYSSLAISGSSVYLAYQDDTTNEAKLRVSTDGGETWPAPTTILDRSSDIHPEIAVGTSRIFASIGYVFDWFAFYSDDGSLWTQATTDPAGGTDSSIVVSGENVYVAYRDTTNDDLRFAHSTNNGVDWSAVQIDDVGDYGGASRLAVDGSMLYALYRADPGLYESDLRLGTSADGGATWTTSVIYSEYPLWVGDLAAVSGTLYITFATREGVHFAVSSDGGVTWPAMEDTVLTRVTADEHQLSPKLAVSGGTVHLTYYDPVDDDLIYLRSPDGGTTWE